MNSYCMHWIEWHEISNYWNYFSFNISGADLWYLETSTNLRIMLKCLQGYYIIEIGRRHIAPSAREQPNLPGACTSQPNRHTQNELYKIANQRFMHYNEEEFIFVFHGSWYIWSDHCPLTFSSIDSTQTYSSPGTSEKPSEH